MEFICITQSSSLTTFAGPSGENYLSGFQQPFKVKNKQDIEQFKGNKRFKAISFFNPAPAPESIMDVDEELEATLFELKGIKKSTARKLADTFMTIQKLKDAVEMGEKLNDIPRKQAKIIIEWILDPKEEKND